VIVAGTQDGAVLSSADLGKTWARQQLGATSLVGMAVCPDHSFIGIDFYHKVWSSDGAGANWKSAAIEKPRVPLAVSCDGQGRWWVAGSGAKLAVSADKGATWTVTDLKEDAQFTTIQMVDKQFGVAMGEFGMVVTTKDGGATWQQTAKIPNEFYPYAALFTSAQEGWASGLAGQVLHTQDGGKSWNKDENRSGAAFYQLFMHNGHVYGVGAGGTVARNEGKTWQLVSYPDAAPVFLGAGTSVGKTALALGGPGGLVRTIVTDKN
jgi:photosystem II stability/assembly factor-like uncharacterized protein